MNEIVCPINNIDVIDRINLLFDNIEKYISSDAFKELVILFGGLDYTNLSLREKIDYLSEFVKVWDYRNSNERWAIKNNDFIDQNKELIRKLLTELNLINSRPLKNKPDYILVLGGAKYSNFDRPKKAKQVFDECNKEPIVVALTCDRKINEVEYEAYHEYDDIFTEEDAIGRGIEKNFGVEVESKNDNITKYNGNIYMISARKNQNGIRANTFDTFQEFINIFDIKDKNILLVTNQPYTSYQLLKFMDFAFANNLFIEAIGCDGTGTLKEANYLQELKSNIDAIKVLYDKYLREMNHER